MSDLPENNEILTKYRGLLRAERPNPSSLVRAEGEHK